MTPTKDTDFEKLNVTPLDALHAVHEAFFTHLGSLLAVDEDEKQRLEARIRENIGVLQKRTEQLVTNDLDRGNVGFTLLAVAAYDELSERMPAERAMALVYACMNEPMRDWVLQGTRQMLDASGDPFESVTSASKQREVEYFGPSFEFERPVDDGFGYVLNVRRCLFHETLKACGRTELQPVLCRFDLNWIDAIDPERHHMRFARPSTFATANLCRMWFMRLESTDGATPTHKTQLPVAHGTKNR